MDKKVLGLSIVGVLVMVGLIFYMARPRCKPAEEKLQAEAQLACVLQINPAALRAEICTKMHGAPECEFTDADQPEIERLLVESVDNCAKELLVDNGYCTDNYKGF